MIDNQYIFDHFCEYVDNTIFSKEKVGSAISFVVDQSFIDTFCKNQSVAENRLFEDVKRHLFETRPSILHIKGLLAIQLFAASKRAHSDGITEANYRVRLRDLLDWNLIDLQKWMVENQDHYWETLYDWCDKHFFEITKCYPKSGAGRYVQYPIQQAKRVFTIEDLKYIAHAFIEENLHPFEYISENDFWHSLHWSTLKKNAYTKHSQDILSNEEYSKDTKRQIYNYFNSWDGEYKVKEKTKTLNSVENEYIVLLQKDFSSIEIRDTHLKLVKKISLDDLSYGEYRKHCLIRRSGLAVFKTFDIYDNYYIETRYIEPEEEGVAVVFKNQCTHAIQNQTWNQIKDLKFLKIFRILEDSAVDDLYSRDKTYELFGGLKTGRNQYLKSGGPMLKINDERTVWINSEMIIYDNSLLNLKDLPFGKNTIKIQGEKPFIIEIRSDSERKCNWNSKNNKWLIDRKNTTWSNCDTESGAVGLDLSLYGSQKDINDTPVLEAWSKTLQGIKTTCGNSIILNLKNITGDEQI